MKRKTAVVFLAMVLLLCACSESPAGVDGGEDSYSSSAASSSSTASSSSMTTWQIRNDLTVTIYSFLVREYTPPVTAVYRDVTLGSLIPSAQSVVYTTQHSRLLIGLTVVFGTVVKSYIVADDTSLIPGVHNLFRIQGTTQVVDLDDLPDSSMAYVQRRGASVSAVSLSSAVGVYTR